MRVGRNERKEGIQRKTRSILSTHYVTSSCPLNPPTIYATEHVLASWFCKPLRFSQTEPIQSKGPIKLSKHWTTWTLIHGPTLPPLQNDSMIYNIHRYKLRHLHLWSSSFRVGHLHLRQERVLGQWIWRRMGRLSQHRLCWEMGKIS
jgi:hypothetical protein